jgi:hypothetical protein
VSLVSKTLFFREKTRELNRYRSWRYTLIFLFCGLVLFGFVWWPIQAERARFSLKQWEEKIALKKAEYNSLRSRYQALTSLPALDHWAQRHGPWKTVTAADVISI